MWDATDSSHFQKGCHLHETVTVDYCIPNLIRHLGRHQVDIFSWTGAKEPHDQLWFVADIRVRQTGTCSVSTGAQDRGNCDVS